MYRAPPYVDPEMDMVRTGPNPVKQQLVPKPRFGDIKRPTACDGVRRAETGLRRRLACV